jgi:hypothetical protein
MLGSAVEPVTAPPARAAPARSHFMMQAGALVRKNARFQQRNWCALTPWAREGRHCSARATPHAACAASSCTRKTNACLVLTPLVFSVVLGGARRRRPHAPRARCTRPSQPRVPPRSRQLRVQRHRVCVRDVQVRLPLPRLCHAGRRRSVQRQRRASTPPVRPRHAPAAPADASRPQPRYATLVDGELVWNEPLVDSSTNKCAPALAHLSSRPFSRLRLDPSLPP